MKWVDNLTIRVDISKVDTYQWDFKELTNQGTNTDWLESGDTVSSFTVTPASGVTVVSSALANTNTSVNVELNFSGCTAGTTYKVDFNVVSVNGREDDFPVYFYVYNK